MPSPSMASSKFGVFQTFPYLWTPILCNFLCLRYINLISKQCPPPSRLLEHQPIGQLITAAEMAHIKGKIVHLHISSGSPRSCLLSFFALLQFALIFLCNCQYQHWMLHLPTCKATKNQPLLRPRCFLFETSPYLLFTLSVHLLFYLSSVINEVQSTSCFLFHLATFSQWRMSTSAAAS